MSQVIVINMTNKLKFNKSHPKLVNEWNYKKNNLIPNEVYARSDIKVWWICSVQLLMIMIQNIATLREFIGIIVIIQNP
jgi:hypothetical protein